MSDPKTKPIAIDLVGSAGTLLLFIQDEGEISKIAQEADALLTWLGTPPGFITLLFYIDDERNITAKEWPSKSTVNGGWTIPGNDLIVIYRQEEWDRVLLHETIHAMHWDWEMPTKPLVCWGFDKDEVISPHLFEAWTELSAEWLWCGWHNIPWSEQREWQDTQAVQILARDIVSGRPWKENTNIFAYYVLKAALAPHVAFLWLARNGRTPEERLDILCRLTEPEIKRLRKEATTVKPTAFALRMTRPDSRQKNE